MAAAVVEAAPGDMGTIERVAEDGSNVSESGDGRAHARVSIRDRQVLSLWQSRVRRCQVAEDERPAVGCLLSDVHSPGLRDVPRIAHDGDFSTCHRLLADPAFRRRQTYIAFRQTNDRRLTRQFGK